jgi:hypothetical protein
MKASRRMTPEIMPISVRDNPIFWTKSGNSGLVKEL